MLQIAAFEISIAREPSLLCSAEFGGTNLDKEDRPCSACQRGQGWCIFQDWLLYNWLKHAETLGASSLCSKYTCVVVECYLQP